jgi:very-short-patch-repair endonuclease
MEDVIEALAKLGGFATWRQLITACSRRGVEAAVAEGVVVRVSRGRYALPTAAEGRRSAHQLSGVAMERSAAAHWRWSMKWQPTKPVVAVPRGRRVPQAVQLSVRVVWRRLDPVHVVDGWVTSRVRTVIDCALRLPFDEALAIADSALRSGQVTRAEILAAIEALPMRGRATARKVVRLADARSVNAFESVLRAIALDVAGLSVVPQHRIDSGLTGKFIGRVDLADLGLRIVLEADSFEFHGKPELMEKDCERYDELVIDDWLVLRFAWKQVMRREAWVRRILEGAVRRRELEGRAAA